MHSGHLSTPVYCYVHCPGPDGCDCFDADGREIVEPDTPLADHGKPLGLFGSLWVVLRGLRLYG